MATAMVQRSTSVVVKQSTKQELFNCAATELIDEAPEDFFEDVVLQKPQKRVTLVDAYSTEERHANEAAEGHTAAPGKSSLESQPTMSTADTNSSLVAGVEDGEGISSAGGKSDSGTDARQEAMNRRCDEVPLHSADSYFTSDIPLPKGIPVRELRELAEKNSRGAPEALYEFLFNENGWAPNGTHKGVVCERMEVEGNEWLGCRGKMNLGKAIDPLDIRDILGGRASHSSSPSSSSSSSSPSSASSAASAKIPSTASVGPPPPPLRNAADFIRSWEMLGKIDVQFGEGRVLCDFDYGLGVVYQYFKGYPFLFVDGRDMVQSCHTKMLDERTIVYAVRSLHTWPEEQKPTKAKKVVRMDVEIAGLVMRILDDGSIEGRMGMKMCPHLKGMPRKVMDNLPIMIDFPTQMSRCKTMMEQKGFKKIAAANRPKEILDAVKRARQQSQHRAAA